MLWLLYTVTRCSIALGGCFSPTSFISEFFESGTHHHKLQLMLHASSPQTTSLALSGAHCFPQFRAFHLLKSRTVTVWKVANARHISQFHAHSNIIEQAYKTSLTSMPPVELRRDRERV
ncbi:hypothetical protein F4604DRAFT_357747 [Suillus subluteus]|nr:hypothetical protein F4604DRAFT_357747 [Suillus subluteus]